MSRWLGPVDHLASVAIEEETRLRPVSTPYMTLQALVDIKALLAGGS